MFSKIRNALSGSSPDSNSRNFSPTGKSCLTPKFPYSRPHFLALSEDQVQASADHRTRPIITPNHGMSFLTGYAECINAGKSKWNEDQAVSHHGVLKSGNFVMPYKFYALFDGHAGVGASICAANQMHHVVHERLVDTQDDIWADFLDTANPKRRNLLITGALEAAFKEMDDIIKGDRATLQSSGGCTAIVAIFLLGQLFVANAGDSRAIVCNGFGFQAMSTDFTPETDRSRIRQLAQTKPELLGNDFTYMEYIRQPRVNDLGKRTLYRDAFMTGWAHKTIAPEDLKISIISGQGKRSRVMGTIGVTRGFGDHELVSVHQKVPIKPFLSCHPEVKVYNLTNCSSYDVLVMGTDGLWDVVDGHTVTQIVNYAVDNFPKKEMCATAAACLVGAARGSLKENCWMMKSGKLASVDDISVFVIPLYPCSHLTYKLRKELPTEGEIDSALMEDVMDNSSTEEIPVDSNTSGSASSDDYSMLIQSPISVPKVTISGISLSEKSKSDIVLQEDEEVEGETDEPLSTTEDIETDTATSDGTVPTAKSHGEKGTIMSQEVGQLSGTSSETPLVSRTSEATSQVSCDVPFQYPVDTIDPEQQRNAKMQSDLGAQNNTMLKAQGDATATLEPHIRMQREYQYLSSKSGKDTQKIVTETFVATDSKSQYVIQQTEALVSRIEEPQSPIYDTSSSSPGSALFVGSPSTVSEGAFLTPRRESESASTITSISSDDIDPLEPVIPKRFDSSDVSTDEDIRKARKESMEGRGLYSEQERKHSPPPPLQKYHRDDAPQMHPMFMIDPSNIAVQKQKRFDSSADISTDEDVRKARKESMEGRGLYSGQERKHSPPPPLQKYHRDDAPQMHPMFMIDPSNIAVQKQKRFDSSADISTDEDVRKARKESMEGRGLYPEQERRHSPPPPLQKYHRDVAPQMHPMFMIDPSNIAVQKQKRSDSSADISTDEDVRKPRKESMEGRGLYSGQERKHSSPPPLQKYHRDDAPQMHPMFMIDPSNIAVQKQKRSDSSADISTDEDVRKARRESMEGRGIYSEQERKHSPPPPLQKYHRDDAPQMHPMFMIDPSNIAVQKQKRSDSSADISTDEDVRKARRESMEGRGIYSEQERKHSPPLPLQKYHRDDAPQMHPMFMTGPSNIAVQKQKRFDSSADISTDEDIRKTRKGSMEGRGIYSEQERKHSPPPPLQKYHRDDAPQMHPMFMIDPFNIAVQKQKLYTATQTTSDARRMPEYLQGSSKSPEQKHRRGNIESLEPISRSPDHKPMHKTEHIRVSPESRRSPDYKQTAADNRSPESRRRSEHTRVSRSPESKHRTERSPDSMYRHEKSPERTRDIKAAQQPSFKYPTETTPERMRQLQMLEYMSKQQEVQQEKHERKLMPVRSMSPPPQAHGVYRERTKSFPPCEMVQPDPSTGAYKKQYSQYVPTTSSPPRKQEDDATTHRQTLPPEIVAAEQQIRAHEEYLRSVKPDVKSKSKPQRPAPKKRTLAAQKKSTLKEAKWEFYSDYDGSDENPPK